MSPVDQSARTPKKGYADTSRGQVHYRFSAAEGAIEGAAPTLILMHWVPGTGRMYERVLPLLARAGFDAYALDMMGFGRSSPREVFWTIGDYADNVCDVLDFLGKPQAFILGGHFSGAVACDLALRRKDRVRKVILDGSPCWDEAGRKKVLEYVTIPRPTLDGQGAYKTFPWERAVAALKDWDASFEVTQETLDDVYLMIIDYLEMRFDRPAKAVVDYDMRSRLSALDLPVLALTSTGEKLYALHDTVMTRAPRCREHIFEGAHPVLEPARGAEYVDVITAFLKE